MTMTDTPINSAAADEGSNFTISSGNVYADLSFADPDLELAKAQLAVQIGRLIKVRGLTQSAAGRVLGIAQPDVSLITRGVLADFSIERLMNLLKRFDQEIEIVVRPADAGRGRLIATVPSAAGPD
jgi:predicted XRE-type DNA-binding protein